MAIYAVANLSGKIITWHARFLTFRCFHVILWLGSVETEKKNKASSSLSDRGFSRDIGATFGPVRVHSASRLSLCICLHDTGAKSHTSIRHTGMSSSRWLYWIEILIMV